MGLETFLEIALVVLIVGISVSLFYYVLNFLGPAIGAGTGGSGANLTLGNVSSTFGTIVTFLGIAVVVLVIVLIIGFVMLLRKKD